MASKMRRQFQFRTHNKSFSISEYLTQDKQLSVHEVLKLNIHSMRAKKSHSIDWSLSILFLKCSSILSRTMAFYKKTQLFIHAVVIDQCFILLSLPNLLLFVVMVQETRHAISQNGIAAIWLRNIYCRLNVNSWVVCVCWECWFWTQAYVYHIISYVRGMQSDRKYWLLIGKQRHIRPQSVTHQLSKFSIQTDESHIGRHGKLSVNAEKMCMRLRLSCGYFTFGNH